MTIILLEHWTIKLVDRTHHIRKGSPNGCKNGCHDGDLPRHPSGFAFGGLVHLVFMCPAHLKFLCHCVLLVCVCLPKYAPHPTSITVPSQSTPATTLTVIAMMITLKKKDTTLCSITSLRMLLDDTATSEVWQHMLNTTAKYVKSQ